MKHSDTIGKLSDSLSKAQKAFKPIVKDKIAKVSMKAGGSYTFRFADLSTVIAATRDALCDNGIAVVQGAEVDGASVRVTTRLSHTSGEWSESDITMKVEDSRPQGIGSAITYARRYGLASMLCVSSEDDDDGNAASGNKADIAHRDKSAPQPAAPADMEDALASDAEFIVALNGVYKAHGFNLDQGHAATTAYLARCEITDITHLSLEQRHALLAAIAEGKADRYKTNGKAVTRGV